MIVRYGKDYEYYKRIVKTDDEANKYATYDDTSQIIHAYIYPANGQVQAQQYGQDLSYILNMLTNDGSIEEGDAIKVYADSFDYKVISKKIYTNHFLLELKKI